MSNPRPNRRQVGHTLDEFTVNIIDAEAKIRGFSKGDAVDLIVKEWLELSNKEAPEPVIVPLYDRNTKKRVDELQKTVEALAQKIQTLTLKERLGRYSGS